MRIFQKMCRCLARAGADVHLVAAHGTVLKDTMVDGVHVHLLSSPKGRRERLTRTGSEVWKKALALQPDIVHFHDPELLLGRKWRADPQVRVVYDVHEDLREQLALKKWIPIRMQLLSRIVGRIEETLSASAHRIITVDSTIRRRFLNRDVPLVRNFPDLDMLGGIKPASRPNGSQDKWVAICPGSLCTSRGTDVMVRTFEHLSDKFELWLVGDIDPVELTEWQKWPGWQRVRHFPLMSHRETLALVKASDTVLHLPRPCAQYRWAQYPTKGLEALACGVVPVLSDFECLRKTFGDTAVYVDPQAPLSIATVLQRVEDEHQRTRAKQKKGLALARARYSWSAEFRELLRVYKQISPDCHRLEAIDRL